MNYLVYDLETSIKNRGEERVGTFKANPHHPDNKIVLGGAYDGKEIATGDMIMPPRLDDLVVGHNIGFDLLYLLRGNTRDLWLDWITAGGKIWDTMIVEYLLYGQMEKYASLDKVSEKYGGTLKPDLIKEYWDADVDTEDIPKGELEEYLEGDLRNTDIVFNKQLELADEQGQLPLIFTQMEARLATIMMEHNGMHFDTVLALSEQQFIEIELERTMNQATDVMDRYSEHKMKVELNPSSATHLAAFLFGGEVKQLVSEQVLNDDGTPYRYKTGKRKGEIKTHKMTKTFKFDGRISDHLYTSMGKRTWNVGENTLKRIIEKSTDVTSVGLAELVLKIRSLSKDVSTYYKGYIDLTWPTDSRIHPSFNHCATNTGRLSCSNPNLQQVSGK